MCITINHVGGDLPGMIAGVDSSTPPKDFGERLMVRGGPPSGGFMHMYRAKFSHPLVSIRHGSEAPGTEGRRRGPPLLGPRQEERHRRCENPPLILNAIKRVSKKEENEEELLVEQTESWKPCKRRRKSVNTVITPLAERPRGIQGEPRFTLLCL